MKPAKKTLYLNNKVSFSSTINLFKFSGIFMRLYDCLIKTFIPDQIDIVQNS